MNKQARLKALFDKDKFFFPEARQLANTMLAQCVKEDTMTICPFHKTPMRRQVSFVPSDSNDGRKTMLEVIEACAECEDEMAAAKKEDTMDVCPVCGQNCQADPCDGLAMALVDGPMCCSCGQYPVNKQGMQCMNCAFENGGDRE